MDTGERMVRKIGRTGGQEDGPVPTAGLPTADCRLPSTCHLPLATCHLPLAILTRNSVRYIVSYILRYYVRIDQ